ncbi:hypothetical protein BEC74_12070 [Escherichia coli]|nr:hypothetical protein [Escherichia coli]
MKTVFNFYGFVYTDGLCGNCRREQICATLGAGLKNKKIYLLERFTVFFIRLNMQR